MELKVVVVILASISLCFMFTFVVMNRPIECQCSFQCVSPPINYSFCDSTILHLQEQLEKQRDQYEKQLHNLYTTEDTSPLVFPIQLLRERPYTKQKRVEIFEQIKNGTLLNINKWFRLPYVWSDAFDASHECIVGEERIGYLGNGGKWICGIRLLKKLSNCVVYSLGSANQWDFEQDILSEAPNCEVHTFDTLKFTPPDPRIHFHQTTISGFDDLPRKIKSIPTIMKELNHTRITIFKVDIEGSEHGIFREIAKSKEEKPIIDQLLIEIHYDDEKDAFNRLQKTVEIMTTIESFGLKQFHRDTNLGSLTCSEFSFAQEKMN